MRDGDSRDELIASLRIGLLSVDGLIHVIRIPSPKIFPLVAGRG
jgi:hypothetical protein